MERQGSGTRGWGEKRRGWGLGTRGWALIALPMTVIAAQNVLARGEGSNAEERGHKITVRVYDYAHVLPRTLGQSEGEASRILRAVGVEMEWVDCPTSVEEAAKYPACEPPLGTLAVDLRILPPSMAARVRSSREELGLA